MPKQKKSTGKFLAKQRAGNSKGGKGGFKKKSSGKKPTTDGKKKVDSAVSIKAPVVVDPVENMDVDAFLNGCMLETEAESDIEDGSDEEDDNDDMADDMSSSEDEAMDMADLEDTKMEQDSDDDESEDEEDDDDEADETSVKTVKKGKEQPAGKVVLTIETLEAMEKRAFEVKSFKGVRAIVHAFHEACKIDEAVDSESMKTRYVIQSSVVYNRLMMSVFRQTHLVLGSMLEDAEGVEKAAKYTNHANWNKVEIILRHFVSATISLLRKATDFNIQKFALRHLAPYIPYIAASSKLARRLLQVLLLKWSSVGGDKTEEDEVCMLAYLRIRGLALATPFPFIETCLKGMYLAYHRRSKFTTETSLRALTLMGNCVVELYGMDLTSSFQHAFVYIRQLAINLRRAITSKTTEAMKQVLNWQFCNSLKLWTSVIVAYPKSNTTAGLSSLVYPLTQILIGTIRLIPTARYFPLRCHCVALMQQLAAGTNTFIPTAPYLLDILQSPEMNRRTRGSPNQKPIDLAVCLKLSKSSLDTQQVLGVVMSKAFALLNAELDIYKFNIAFPEMTVPIQLALRKFANSNRVPRWTTMVKGIVQNTKKRSDWIVSKRGQVEFAPKDITGMETFLEADAKNAKERMEQATMDRERKEKVDRENAEVEATKKKMEKKEEKTSSSKKIVTILSKPMQPEAFSKAMDAIEEDDVVEDLEWSDDEN